METSRPLIVVSQESLLDSVVQLAAAAGCELDRAPDVVAARSRWQSAPLVLLDLPAATACAAERLPRRPEVYLLGTSPPASIDDWALLFEIGAERLILLPDNEELLLTALADATDRPAEEPGRVVAVLGGRGGAGASVLASATALASLRRGRNTLLVDGDPLGGGLDLVLGAEIEPGPRWPDLRIDGGRVPISALRSALPGRHAYGARLSMVSCDRGGVGPTPEAMAAVLEAGIRAGDTVVCDLPRQLSPTVVAALDRADLIVLVVPAELRAVSAARQLAADLTKSGYRLATVVRGPAPGRLDAEDIARALDLPLLTALRSEARLPVQLELAGLQASGRGPLAKAANTVLAALATAPSRVVPA